MMMPKEEKMAVQTKNELLARITGLLGGRVAEELFLGEMTTGASDDFSKATKIARAMVTEYGMSNLGPIQYEQPQGSVFLGRDYLKDKNFSDQVALEIDKEVRKIIEECYDRAREVISSNKELLTNIAEYLLKLETINKSEIDEIAATGHIAWYDKLHEAKKPEEPKVEEAPVDAESVQAEPTEAVEAKTEPVKEEKAEATEDKPAEEAPKKPRAPRKKKTEEPKEEENK